jgi:hypothetical protein
MMESKQVLLDMAKRDVGVKVDISDTSECPACYNYRYRTVLTYNFP